MLSIQQYKRAASKSRASLFLFWAASFLLSTQASQALGEARVLGDVSNAVPETLTLSPNGKRFAVVTVDARTKSRRVIVDGKVMGKLYDSIAEGTPLFSFDGSRVAFVARRGDRCHVVTDGVESEGYLLARDGWPIAGLLFSPHNKYLAYKARVEGATMLVVNGENFGPYQVSVNLEGDRLWGVWDHTFSPDGEYFAFRARVKDKMVACSGKVLPDPSKKEGRLTISPTYDSIGRGTPLPVPGLGAHVFGFIAAREGRECVVLGTGKEGQLGKWYATIGRGSVVRPPHDPRRLDYLAQDNGKWRTIIGGQEGALYDEIGTLMYAADGRSAYVARKGKEVVLVVQGQEGPPQEGIRYPGTVFSPDGRTVAYAARSAGASTLIVNDQPGPRCGQIDSTSLIFSADGKRLAYAASRGGKHFVVLGDKAGPEFDEVSGLRFSPDGSRLGYRARKGLEHFLVLDDENLGPFDDLSPDVSVFSPDGNRLAYAALKGGQWQVFLDGKEAGPACEGFLARLTFRGDGKHLAYAARFFDGTRLVCAMVVAGQPGSYFDAIWMGEDGKLYLDEPGSAYFARKGPLAYRVSFDWPK